MRRWSKVILILFIIAAMSVFIRNSAKPQTEKTIVPVAKHWFLLHRKSNTEYFYLGVPGDKKRSKLLKQFIVKTVIPGERPTPLPKLTGRDYWILTKKASSQDNPETAPYFLTLNVPGWEDEPFGPSPYFECGGPAGQRGMQCNWVVAGEFGLHGVNGDKTRLEKENPGSSGCVRHKDADITYLYNTLDPQKEEIRYYIEDI